MARESSVTFYRNVNLDRTSGNTYYFATRAAQTSFFNSKIYTTVTGTSYLRENAMAIRVYQPIGEMLKCDYLSFKNPQYENKTFYCFITGVNYINDRCTEINYEIDMIQTWLLDCSFKSCMIERNHTATDNLFENLVPDDFSPGDMLTEYQRVYSINRFSVIFQATFDIYEWINSGFVHKYEPKIYNRSSLYDGYSMVGIEVYKSSSNFAGDGSMFALMLLKIFMTEGDVSLEDFTNIWIYPSDLIQHVDSEIYPDLPVTVDSDLRSYWKVGNAKRIVDYFMPQMITTLDGYTPRNKKLFNYPTCLLHVSNCDGNAKDLKLERFNRSVSGDTFPFVLSGTTTNEGKIRLTPGDYMGVDDPNITNAQYDPTNFLVLPYEESIDSMCFPVVSVVSDLYNIYYAQNHNRIDNYYENTKISTVMDVASFILNPLAQIGGAQSGSAAQNTGAAGAGASQAGAGAAGAGAAGVAAFAATKTSETIQYIKGKWTANNDLIANWSDMKAAPNEAKGLQSVGLAFQHGYKGFIFEVKTCDRVRAENLDCFYDMFGYPIKKIMNPGNLLNNRPYWTYIKTAGCMLSGQIPEYAKDILQALFDAGLTFWNAGGSIGDYSQNNQPV